MVRSTRGIRSSATATSFSSSARSKRLDGQCSSLSERELQGIDRVMVAGAGLLKPGQVHRAHLDEPGVILLERQAELDRYLVFDGYTAVFLLRHHDGRFDHFGLASLVAGRPVELPQTVQDSAPDFVLGVG